MINFPYSLVIEATADPDFFGFYLDGVGGLHRHRSFGGRLPLQGSLGHARARGFARSAEAAGAAVESESDGRHPERRAARGRVN